MSILIVSITILLLIAAYLFCLKPGKSRKEQMMPFEDTFIAHRGLFNNKGEAPENSLPAFEKAVSHQYGIELDVQLTADRQLVVFHDESLARMCGVDRLLRDCNYEELKNYSLKKTDERIPLFSEVLERINGKVPLVVEIKSEGDWRATTEEAARILNQYQGIYCVESFHPGVLKWYRKNRPQIIRGQLSMDYFKHNTEKPWAAKFIMTNLLLNCQSRPDFIAYDHRQANQLSYRLCRFLFKPENIAWTIKSPKDLKSAKAQFQCFIFDSFLPEERGEKENGKI